MSDIERFKFIEVVHDIGRFCKIESVVVAVDVGILHTVLARVELTIVAAGR